MTWRRAVWGGCGCGDGVLERRKCDSGVAAGPARQLFDETRIDVRLRVGEAAVFVFEGAIEDPGEFFRRERFEHDHAAARKQRGVDLE